MFLRPLMDKNPAFVEAVVALHRAGSLPANSYALDLDAMAANTSHLMGEARALGLSVYAMTKQVGRAPGALEAISGAGVDGYVAVDMACARPIAAHGHNLGHLGHLVQVPAAETGEAAAMQPDYWTVFSPNKATEVSAAATRLGRVQDLLVRVFAPGDEFYSGHEGGVPLEELPRVLDHISGLPGVRFAGLTTFPALLFDPDSGGARTTPNMATLAQAAETAQQHIGHEDQGTLQINAPGTTSTAVLAQLAEAGATQVEPPWPHRNHTPACGSRPARTTRGLLCQRDSPHPSGHPVLLRRRSLHRPRIRRLPAHCRCRSRPERGGNNGDARGHARPCRHRLLRQAEA